MYKHSSGAGVLTPIDGRFAAPAELTQHLVRDERLHHPLDVALEWLGIVDFLM